MVIKAERIYLIMLADWPEGLLTNRCLATVECQVRAMIQRSWPT